MQLVASTALFPSPLLSSISTLKRGSQLWRATYAFSTLRNDDRAEMMALIAELGGQENRLRVPVFDNPKRGAYGGTPLVDGAGQTGKSIDIKGLSTGITDWIKRGDYFSIVVNGQPELKICRADASSDGSGLATLVFEPKLRAVPADEAAIYVEDGVLTKPEGLFILTEQTNGWSSRPGHPSKVSTVTLQMIEDVFISQS